MATLKLTFEDRDGQDHKLHFMIYNSDLAGRWMNITNRNKEHGEKNITARFTNTVYKDIDRVRTRLTNCINSINAVYDEPLPLYTELKELSTYELNYLHEEFERYGDRMDELIAGGTHWTRDMHEDFLQLNEIIHLHEDVLKSKTAEFPNMAVLYDYYPQEFHEPIFESDKIWLTPYLRWGEIYLGYNTLGKDWLKVHCDNDIEVIERDQVRPQTRFAAEAWINFGPDSNGWWSIYDFEQWVKGLPEHVRKKVPIDNLNELSYGRYKIGRLLIDKDFLSTYGGTADDFAKPCSKAKLDWNMNVFSTFIKLKNVQFV